MLLKRRHLHHSGKMHASLELCKTLLFFFVLAYFLCQNSDANFSFFQIYQCYFSCISDYNLVVIYGNRKGMNLTAGKKQVCNSSLFKDPFRNEGENSGQINSSLKERIQTLVVPKWKEEERPLKRRRSANRILGNLHLFLGVLRKNSVSKVME